MDGTIRNGACRCAIEITHLGDATCARSEEVGIVLVYSENHNDGTKSKDPLDPYLNKVLVLALEILPLSNTPHEDMDTSVADKLVGTAMYLMGTYHIDSSLNSAVGHP